MVGRLIEHESFRLREKDARKFDAATLTARERAEFGLEQAVIDPEVCRKLLRLRLGRVTPLRF